MSTLLVVIVIVIILGLAEGAVQFRQWLLQGHSGQITDLFEQQGDLRVLIPGATTRTISINPLGFRGPPLTEEKSAETLRIAFVGASTTFCAEVSGNEVAWPHLVTGAIQKRYPGLGVDYINAAVPGYTVKTSLQNFHRRVAPLHPDVTIIYHATNDLSAETRSLAEEQGIYEGLGEQKNSWLADHSLLWYLVEKNLYLKVVQRNVVDARQRLEFSPSMLGVRFRQELTELVRAAQQSSEVVALATFSNQVRPEQTPEQQLVAANSALYYMPFMTLNGLVEAFTRYNTIIADVARETGAILIDTEMAIPGDSEHFNDTVHFTDAGSIIMASSVSEALLNSVEFQTLAKGKQSDN